MTLSQFLLIARLILLLLVSLALTNEECGLNLFQYPNVQNSIRRDPILMIINEPELIECQLDCIALGSSTSNCNITHDWVLRIPYRRKVSEKISRVQEAQRNTTIDGLSIIFEPETFPSDLCTNGSSSFRFSINLILRQHSPELKEISVICGIERPNMSGKHDILNFVVLRGDGNYSNSAMVHSKDIDDNPIKVTHQGGNMTFTCTRLADSLLSPVWRLLSSNMLLSNYLLNESSTITLKNEVGLMAIIDANGETYNFKDREVQDFSVTFFNLPFELNGLRVWCGVQTEDGELHFHNHSATVNILRQGEESIIVFSNDTDSHPYLSLQKGGKITCTKRRGYFSDVRVQLLADDGTIPNNSELTISMNREQLKQLGVSIRKSTNENSEHLWQDFEIIILLTNVTLIMTVQCGARSPEGTHFKFYDRVVVATALDYTSTVAHYFDTGERRGFIIGISSISILLVTIIIVASIVLTIVYYVCGRHHNGRVATQQEHIEDDGVFRRRPNLMVMESFSIENDDTRH